APEHVRGSGTLDARSDLYALGVILYEMCTGSVPFESDSVVGLMMKHLQEPLPPFSAFRLISSLPEELENTVKRALAKEPGERHPTVRDFVMELEGIALRYVPGLGTGHFRSETYGVGVPAPQAAREKSG